MKNKIKVIVYSISSVVLILPVLANAQFTAPSGTNLPQSSIMNIVSNIMNWLLIIIGIVGVIGFAIAGILYLTAAGDEDRMGKAKNAMLYSIIGVIVALAGVVAINFAQHMLNAQKNF